MKLRHLFPAAALLLAASTMFGCDEKPAQSASNTDTPKTDVSSNETDKPDRTSMTPTSNPEAPQEKYDPPKEQKATAKNTDVKRQPKPGEEVAVMETNQGRIVLMFFPDVAPMHVESFKNLAKKGYFDGIKFHRAVPGFMIQGGDPNTKNSDPGDDGQGGPGYTIPAEFNDVKHDRGILSAARSQDPNSAGSQFFIVVSPSYFLDHNYTVYGRVVSGLDVADKIVNLKTDESEQGSGGKAGGNILDSNPAVIKSVKIEKWPIKG